MKIVRYIMLALILMVGLCGCNKEEDSAVEYPFAISETAVVSKYPADNFMGLASIITDVNGDDCILAFEFAKNVDLDDAKQFALTVQEQKGVHGCSENYENLGASNRYYETDDFFYIYLFFKKTKDVKSVCIDGDNSFYWIELLENDGLQLELREYMVVVDGEGGESRTRQAYDNETKAWGEPVFNFWPDEVGIN